MSDWLNQLGGDTLPPEMIEAFVNWCVWEQARPALIAVLERTGLTEHSDQLKVVNTYAALAQTAERAGHDAHDARKRTGPLGLSAAEAASFLVTRIARAATENEWDPEGVAFYAAQVAGWAGFAESGFANPAQKTTRENESRTRQEEKLSELWLIHRREG
jgi:hypothetical protein